jgi:hypothetical protein
LQICPSGASGCAAPERSRQGRHTGTTTLFFFRR